MDLNIKETENKQEKKIIGVQVPQWLFLTLKIKADERFISISDLIRSYIFKCLEDETHLK